MSDEEQLVLLVGDSTIGKFQRHGAAETQRGAAIDALPLTGQARVAVFRLLTQSGPLTDEEMQNRLGMNPSTQRPRRVELVERGLVVDSGERKLTRSGRSAVLWICK